MKKIKKINRKWAILAVFNVGFITASISTSIIYSKNVQDNQQNNNLTNFITNIESLKQVSQNYINNEINSVNNWSNYISIENKNLDNALDYLREINTNKKRYAHIIDMDNFEAYSSFYPKGEEKITIYEKYFYDNITEYEHSFKNNMLKIFNEQSSLTVLGKYAIPETSGGQALSVGKRVTIKTDNGNKDYLLLRVIPIDEIQKNWIFPTAYKSAEVGIITRKGDYVIQSSSMKSMSFLEFIRGYNFQDDYNKVYELGNLIESTDSGTLYYNNSKSEKCVWYYSSFDENSELDILGCIRYDELQTTNKDWLIVLIICGTILLLSIVDGIYLKNINKKLKESAEEAKQANKAKSYFLSAMSHDIRTPLNAILGMTYIAKNNLDNPDYAKECLDKSSAASQQLLTLINDILDISKIESGKLFLTYQTTSISSVFDTLTEIIKPLALNKKITFTHNLHNIDYNYVSTDKSRLEQICLNLLSNAVKYTNEHGKINLDISEKKLNDEEVLLIIIVEDNGIGMSEEFQKTMYQSFTREINTQVNKTQGTGLGLYIIKLIVDAMGGKISCNSKVNIGTKFKIELNLKIVETPENIDTDKEIDYKKLKGLHILVAEDNKLNREIIQTILQDNEIECELTENGLECINKLLEGHSNTYNAIIMDVHMPIMDGISATKIIRKEHKEFDEIPIIAMTADAFKEDINNCLEAGMDAHLAKPINVKVLLDLLYNLTENK